MRSGKLKSPVSTSRDQGLTEADNSRGWQAPPILISPRQLSRPGDAKLIDYLLLRAQRSQSQGHPAQTFLGITELL